LDAPQDGQSDTNRAPHSPQNFCPSGFSFWHREHCMLEPPIRIRGRTVGPVLEGLGYQRSAHSHYGAARPSGCCVRSALAYRRASPRRLPATDPPRVHPVTRLVELAEWATELHSDRRVGGIEVGHQVGTAEKRRKARDSGLTLRSCEGKGCGEDLSGSLSALASRLRPQRRSWRSRRQLSSDRDQGRAAARLVYEASLARAGV